MSITRQPAWVICVPTSRFSLLLIAFANLARFLLTRRNAASLRTKATLRVIATKIEKAFAIHLFLPLSRERGTLVCSADVVESSGTIGFTVRRQRSRVQLTEMVSRSGVVVALVSGEQSRVDSNL